jgi:hypothetical protein
MMTIVAKPVIKNKYWIVESDGTKIATIQAIEEGGGFAYVHDDTREQFASIKLISKKYNIVFDTAKPTKTKITHEAYGFPCSSKPYNQVWDVQRKLPIYSKEPRSKSLYCAGYYAIKFNNAWITEFCPKNITVTRYEHHGPYTTKAEAADKIKELKA